MSLSNGNGGGDFNHRIKQIAIDVTSDEFI